jgi:hypothetical protein
MAGEEQSGVLSAYTKAELLLEPMDDYDFSQRLDWLRGYEGAQFMPTGKEETSIAFRRIYYGARGITPAQELDTIRMKVQSEAKSPKDLDKADLAVMSAVGTRSAFAAQARRDVGMLVVARDSVRDPSGISNMFHTAAGFFEHNPAMQGSGQLVRYVDALHAIENPSDDVPFAFRAAVVSAEKNPQFINDPYTAVKLNDVMRRHVETELARIKMDELPELLDGAVKNEVRRRDFWIEQIRGMLPDTAASKVARVALIRLGVREILY